MASASRDAAALTITLPIGPIEIPQLHAQSSQNPTPTVEALIVCVSAYAMIPTITRVPRIVLADKPFEIELGVAALEPGADETASAWAARTISCYLSNLAMLSVVIDSEGQVPSLLDVPVAVRHTCGGLIARALVRPSAWADAASVTVASLTLAGRSLPCDCLPATLRVGYNHAPAPKAAVLVASKRGDVPALRGALDDGGSTEETDEIGRTASFWAAYNGHIEVLRSLLAAGANAAEPNRRGETPLHAAAANGHADIVVLLLATPGVDPFARDAKYGKTPLDWAQLYRKEAIAALLQADPRVGVQAP